MPLWTLLLLACSTQSPPITPRTVVVISWDTTRADALGCYSDVSHWGLNLPPDLRPPPKTPIADAIAARGVRFQWALSGAPTTLSSHTSLFSGLDAHQHRVVRNGYPVPADVPLLAEQLHQRGWQTLAVVGSSALEAAMNLDRGFSIYDDPGPQPEGGMYLRDAALVTERALEAVDAHRAVKEGDLFLFVHYYDPHTPWLRPADPDIGVAGYSGPVDGSMGSLASLTEQRQTQKMLADDVRQARALYLSQVSWVDEQTGRLLAGLDERGALDDSLVVVLSDHGESLEEHGRFPYSHGPDVDLMNIHVPLILRGSGSLALPEGVVVSRQARLQDVGTTLLKILEPEAPMLGSGELLSPLWRGALPPAPPAFAEATKPIELESADGWNNLPFERTVIADGLLVVKSPWLQQPPILYRMAPGQPTADDPAALQRLDGLLNGWDAAAPPHQSAAMSAETEAALQSLGYLDEPTP
jgi:arylsulfatase A-like enzyme